MSKVKSASNRSELNSLNGLIAKENLEGHNFVRKEVKIEITNVRAQIKHEKIYNILKGLAKEDMFISEIKNGKLHGPAGRQARSLMFKVNGAGFDLIFNRLNGVIPYNSPDENLTLKLIPRINVRPWSCRECYFIGPNHTNCPGKTCAQCGSKNHITKTCSNKYQRYCTNCRKIGHRARDKHCQAYLNEVIKEIKRMDIPLGFLEDKIKRFDIIKAFLVK